MSKYDIDMVNAIVGHATYDDVPPHLKELYTPEDFQLVSTMKELVWGLQEEVSQWQEKASQLEKTVTKYESPAYRKDIIKAYHRDRNAAQKLNRLQKKGRKVECENCGIRVSVEGKNKHQKTHKCKMACLVRRMNEL